MTAASMDLVTAWRLVMCGEADGAPETPRKVRRAAEAVLYEAMRAAARIAS